MRDDSLATGNPLERKKIEERFNVGSSLASDLCQLHGVNLRVIRRQIVETKQYALIHLKVCRNGLTIDEIK